MCIKEEEPRVQDSGRNALDRENPLENYSTADSLGKDAFHSWYIRTKRISFSSFFLSEECVVDPQYVNDVYFTGDMIEV